MIKAISQSEVAFLFGSSRVYSYEETDKKANQRGALRMALIPFTVLIGSRSNPEPKHLNRYVKTFKRGALRMALIPFTVLIGSRK